LHRLSDSLVPSRGPPRGRTAAAGEEREDGQLLGARCWRSTSGWPWTRAIVTIWPKG